MTNPINQNAYLVASGTGTIYPTVVFNRAPTENDIYPWQITQRWIDNSQNITVTITGASQASSCVITATNSFTVGQVVLIQGVGGMTQLNNNAYIITVVTPTTFTIDVDSTGFGAYTSGGTATVTILFEYFLLNLRPSNGVIYANWVLLNESTTFSGNLGLQTLTGNTGGAVSGDVSKNINLVGDGTTVDIVGTPLTNTLTVSLIGGSAAIEEFLPNSGTTPVVPNASGQVSVLGTGSTTTVGGLNTITVELTGLTDHAVLVGAGTATITKIAPTAVGGAPLLNNVAADPSYSTTFLVNDSTFTAQEYGILDGSFTQLGVVNSSNTANSSCRIYLVNGGSSGGDAYLLFAVGTGGPTSWEVGAANTDGSFNFYVNINPAIQNLAGTLAMQIAASTFVTLPHATTGSTGGLAFGTGGPTIISGSGAPSVSLPKGSLYLRTDGTTTNDRAFIAKDSAGTWTAITTAS